MSTKSKERIHWIDIARGLCIIAIVVGHVFSNGYLRWALYSFHVPAFFFLSGICFKRENSTKEYVKKKLRTIVVPYLFFSVVSIGVFWIAGRVIPALREMTGNSLAQDIMDMIYANSKPEKMRYNLPLWFLPCFFSTSLIVYFEEQLSLKKPKWIRALFTVICIAGGAYFAAHEEIALPWHIETAISMSVWFVAGIWFNEQLKRHRHVFERHSVKLIGAGIFWGGVLLSFLNTRVVGVRNEHYGLIPIYYISASASILGIVFFSMLIRKNGLMELIGRNSLGILVLHKFPILVFQQIIGPTKRVLGKPDTFAGVNVGLIVAIIAIAVSMIGVMAIKRTIPWCLGLGRQEKNEN